MPDNGHLAAMTTIPSDPGVLVCSDDADFRAFARESILTWIPALTVESCSVQGIAELRPLSQHAVVLDASGDAAVALPVLRELRATGYTGSVAVVFTDPSPAVALQYAALGAPYTLLLRELPTRLGEVAAAACRAALPAERWRTLYLDLRATQRTIALGQMASAIKHDLSNPLTVISSEAQMLTMDPDFPEQHHDSVIEIIEMCRKVGLLLRKLDPTIPEKGGARVP